MAPLQDFRPLVFLWASLLAVPCTSTPEVLYAEALRELNAAVSSNYSHTTFVDEAAGIFNYDCSGFVGYAVKRVSVPAWSAIPRSSSVRPLAQDFADYFVSAADSSSTEAAYWSSPRLVSALVPGDVIAWRRPPDSTSSNTGHVMIVASAPRADPVRAGQWLVRVIDSSESAHTNDTRTSSGDDGLGTGWVSLVVNVTSGKPVGFKWRGGLPDSQSPVRLTTVGLGRPLILPTSQPTSQPTPAPSTRPTRAPSPAPSTKPTRLPTRSPSFRPTPSPKPTKAPSPAPAVMKAVEASSPEPAIEKEKARRAAHAGRWSQILHHAWERLRGSNR